MSRILFPLLILLAAAAALVWAGGIGLGPIVITTEGEYKLILRLNEPRAVLDRPGASLRIPLIETVEIFDSRLQYIDAKPVERVIKGGRKLVVDYFVVWRIEDPLEFRRSFPPPNEMAKATERIQNTVTGLVGAKVGELSMEELLQRAEILDQVAVLGSEQLEDRGISVVDVRLNRTEIPETALPSAYEQMREQRRAIARQNRVRGERDSRQIRSEAERDARTTIAAARSQSEILRGEGDAESARIYSDAYSRDSEFYAFVRSLEAYRKSLGSRTTMVLPPDHEFFRFLDPSSVSKRSAKGAPAAVSGPPSGL